MTGEGNIYQAVVQYATSNTGQIVGRGECFDLADAALRGAGALSAADYGEISADADYEWGLAVMLHSALPGYVVQFRNYSCSTVTQITERNAQGQITGEGEEIEEHFRPHHTAIIASTNATGPVTVFEQNANNVRSVQRNELHFTSRTLPPQTVRRGGNSETRRTTITVRGTIHIYQPQPR